MIETLETIEEIIEHNQTTETLKPKRGEDKIVLQNSKRELVEDTEELLRTVEPVQIESLINIRRRYGTI